MKSEILRIRGTKSIRPAHATALALHQLLLDMVENQTGTRRTQNLLYQVQSNIYILFIAFLTLQ